MIDKYINEIRITSRILIGIGTLIFIRNSSLYKRITSASLPLPNMKRSLYPYTRLTGYISHIEYANTTPYNIYHFYHMPLLRRLFPIQVEKIRPYIDTIPVKLCSIKEDSNSNQVIKQLLLDRLVTIQLINRRHHLESKSLPTIQSPVDILLWHSYPIFKYNTFTELSCKLVQLGYAKPVKYEALQLIVPDHYQDLLQAEKKAIKYRQGKYKNRANTRFENIIQFIQNLTLKFINQFKAS